MGGLKVLVKIWQKSRASYFSPEGKTGFLLAIVRVPNQVGYTVQISLGTQWGDLYKLVLL